MRRRSALVGLAIATALGLSGCGSATSSSTATPTSAATSATTAAVSTTAATTAVPARAAGSAKTLVEARAAIAAESGIDDTQAGCVIDKLVAAVGEARAIELTNDPRDVAELAPADGKTVLDAVLGCVSREELATLIADAFLEEGTEAGVTRAHADCVSGKLVTVMTAEALYRMGSGEDGFAALDPADQGKMFNAVIECVPPEVLAKLGEAAAAQGATSTSAP